MTYHRFKKLFGLPDTIFEQLWETLAEHLQGEPDDSIGLSAPSNNTEKRALFSSWAVSYFDNGIGQQYWGPGTLGKWKLEKDRDQILDAFRSLMAAQAHSERQHRQGVPGSWTIVAGRTQYVDDESESYEDNRDTESDDQGDGKDEKLKDEPQPGDDKELYRPPPSLRIKSNAVLEALHGRPHDAAATSPSKHDTAKNEPTRHSEIPAQPVPSFANHQGRPPNTIQQKPTPLKRRRGRPTKEETLARAAASIISEPPSLPPSIRKYALDESSSPKRQRKLELTVQSAKRTRPADRRHDLSPISIPAQIADRVFQTRLGDDKTIVFLFAPPTISFQHFWVQFCQGWRKDGGGMEVDDIDVKVSISGLGEYRLSFGEDRKRSWIHIMKIAESGPESDVLVTVGEQVAVIAA